MEEIKIEQKFVEQAIDISKGAEVLPNGVEELARKLQESYYSKKPFESKIRT